MQPISRRRFIAATAAGALGRDVRAQAHASTAEAATFGPAHHFFGYYGRSPWDASGRYLLAHAVDFADRPPASGDAVRVGIVDLAAGRRFVPLARSAAWSWALGTLVQWLPCAPEREIVYNVRDGTRWAAVRHDVLTGRTRRLSFPIFSVNQDGTLAVSLNFSRLAWTCPGSGYAGLSDPWRHAAAPEGDGVYQVDLGDGSHRLIVALERLVRHRPRSEFTEAYHWVHHLHFSPDGGRIAFLHRWRSPAGALRTRLFTADPDGGALRLLLDQDMASHFTWRDPGTILVWAYHSSGGERFVAVRDAGGVVEAVGADALTLDGRPSYSPDGRWLLADTCPDARDMRTVVLYRVSDGVRFDVGRFHSPPRLTGAVRCDLNPRWNRDGTQVCIDSAHDRTRQMYVIDVARYTA